MSALTLAIVILITSLVIHLAEEVRTGFRFKLIIGTMPRPLFIGINVIIYAYCTTTLWLSLANYELAIPFAWALATAMLINGAGHIGVMLWKRSYFPGGVSAFLLLGAAAYLIAQLAT